MNIKAHMLSVQTNIHFAHCVCVFLTLNGSILARDATFLQTLLPLLSLHFTSFFIFTFYLFLIISYLFLPELHHPASISWFFLLLSQSPTTPAQLSSSSPSCFSLHFRASPESFLPPMSLPPLEVHPSVVIY